MHTRGWSWSTKMNCFPRHPSIRRTASAHTHSVACAIFFRTRHGNSVWARMSLFTANPRYSIPLTGPIQYPFASFCACVRVWQSIITDRASVRGDRFGKGQSCKRPVRSLVRTVAQPTKCFREMLKLGQNDSQVENAIKIVRAIQIAMLLSVAMFVLAGEMVGSIPHFSNPTLFYALSLATITIVGVILVVRRTLVLQSATTLATRPNDIATLN